ncbi:MAG: hypothetical protein ACRERU_14830 [Methylococcales bacterium]
MQLVNAEGQPRDRQGTLEQRLVSDEITYKISGWDYLYDAQDRIVYEIALDRNGQRLRGLIYAPSEAGVGGSRIAYNTKPDGSLARKKGSCEAFGKQMEYDSSGRVTQQTSLGKDGRPMNDDDGTSIFRRSFDESGNEILQEYLDAAGKPIDIKKRGFQRRTCQYDDRGNCVESVTWRADGSRVYQGLDQIFCHSQRLCYNDRGNLVGSDCLIADGQVVLSGQTKYDEHDRPIEDRYFDRNGQPHLGPIGEFRVTLRFNAEGNPTEMAFFDADENPAFCIEGFHKKSSRFEQGREARTEYRDGTGEFVAIDGGYAANKRTFDAQANEVRTAYLGLDGRPVPNRNEGFSIKTNGFDGCGREIESRFLDENERPVRAKKGYSRIRKLYDESNQVKQESYFDGNDQPIRSVDGYARVSRQFDRNRNLIDERYFDEQGKALLLNGAYAQHKLRYDDHNALLEETFWGSNGELVLDEKGWAKHIRRYDDHNALVEEAYFGADGEPVLNEDGYARVTDVWDSHGRVIEIAYFGTDGKPIQQKHGCARIADRYDDYGAWVEEVYFGVNGEPVLYDGRFSRISVIRDKLGREIERAYFGVRGEPVVGPADKPFHRARRILDERDNELEFATFGTDGKPLEVRDATHRRLCAKRVRHFDATNKETGSECFGAAGKLISRKPHG